MEQRLKVSALEHNDLSRVTKEELRTALVALQHQAFVLGNNIQNLTYNWPPPHPERAHLTKS